jgi:hypothetical protein
MGPGFASLGLASRRLQTYDRIAVATNQWLGRVSATGVRLAVVSALAIALWTVVAGAALGAPVTTPHCPWAPVKLLDAKLKLKFTLNNAGISTGSGGRVGCVYFSSTPLEFSADYSAFGLPSETPQQAAADCHGRNMFISGFPGKAYFTICRGSILLNVVGTYASFQVSETTDVGIPHAPKLASLATLESLGHDIFERMVQAVYRFR